MAYGARVTYHLDRAAELLTFGTVYAGGLLADARARRDSLPVDQAAREAWTPGGPSVDEIAAAIRAQRLDMGDAAA